MVFFKNPFFTTIIATAICLSLLMGVLQYLQHAVFQQNSDTQQHTAEMLVSTLNETKTNQSISSQLKKKLELLPGWQAAIYNENGQLQWQSDNLSLTSINAQQVKRGLVSIEMLADEKWCIRYFPLRDNEHSSQQVIAILEPLTPLQKQIQYIMNLILGVAVIIGFIVWFVIRQNTQALKAEIRSYIRHYRKELTHDKLTGLLNREILLDRIEHALSQAQRNESQVAVLYIGLDKFKEINEHLGRASGDQVLRTVASRLSDAIRSSDTLVRIEGDEFALLSTDFQLDDEIKLIANRIVKVFQNPIDLGTKEYYVSASIGITIFDAQQHTSSDTLLFNAYAAMKTVKKQGGGNIYHFFENEMSADSELNTLTESELYQALDNEEFCLFYQPKVDVATGDIKGLEALLRWQHPERGLVSPLEFIPLLEETGHIVMVGEWVLKEACRANKSWQDEGLSPVKVSVNVSLRQLEQDSFAKMVQDVLDSSGLAPAFLELEVTENCLISNDLQILNQLVELKRMGVSISLDNFGTGYSSLGYLKQFPIDTLKIDRSFVSNLHDRRENENAAIVTAIMGLSHSLGLDVVAGGVETTEELTYLNALGCSTIQGFIFSQPLSEEEFKMLLQDSVSLNEYLAPARLALNQ